MYLATSLITKRLIHYSLYTVYNLKLNNVVFQTDTDNGKSTRRCGYIPQQPPYTANTIKYNFRSDDYNQGMGFWLVFYGNNMYY